MTATCARLRMLDVNGNGSLWRSRACGAPAVAESYIHSRWLEPICADCLADPDVRSGRNFSASAVRMLTTEN